MPVIMKTSDSFQVYHPVDKRFLWIAFTHKAYGWPADLVVCHRNGKAFEYLIASSAARNYANHLSQMKDTGKMFASQSSGTPFLFRPNLSPAIPVQGVVSDFDTYKNRFFEFKQVRNALDVFQAPESLLGW